MKSTILVIEDDPLAKQFYTLIFNKSKYNTIVTDNGTEILNTLDNFSVKIIICDVNLKNTYIGDVKVNGVDITRILKANPKYQDIPVIIITALSKKTGGKNLLEESGADLYIPKPIEDFEMFVSQVEDTILI